jgi:HEAT repeat protein
MSMANKKCAGIAIAVALLTASGCGREERGPVLAGGREVKSWVADLHDPKPHVRRTAVLKLGNVGDSDPAAAEGLAEAIGDSDPVVRRSAVGAVAKLSKPSNEVLARIRIMSESDPDLHVRDYAKRAIAHFDKAQ